MENILVKSANSEMVKLNDLELVKLIKKEKNQEAFQEIINRYAGKIYNLNYKKQRRCRGSASRYIYCSFFKDWFI